MAESADNSPIDDVPTTKLDLLENFPEKQGIPPKKILFLGDEKVGKTTFILKFCEHVVDYYKCYGFNESCLVFTQYLLYREYNGKFILIRLMDLPSGTTAESLKSQLPADVDSIVFCFAIDNPASLANVWKKWLPESKRYYPELTRYYLLGLKEDTKKGMPEANEVPVTTDRASQIHQKHKFCGQYMECSVQENPNQAIDMMVTLISNVLHSEPPPATI